MSKVTAEKWVAKLSRLTEGNKTKAGAVILAIARLQRFGPPPAFGNTAIISHDGYLLANFKDKAGKEHFAVTICTDGQYAGLVKGLIDAGRLTDEEAQAFANEARKWIAQDNRLPAGEPVHELEPWDE